jgi:hypothetical protein
MKERVNIRNKEDLNNNIPKIYAYICKIKEVKQSIN